MIIGQCAIPACNLHKIDRLGSLGPCNRLLAVASFMVAFAFCLPVQAQFGNFFGNQNGVVGGVSVDAAGTVRSTTAQERTGWLNDMRGSVQQPSGDMVAQTQLRMISLSRLQSEIAQAISTGQTLNEETLYLAGLQRIEYIFVYPEVNDIVLAGPAEGWVVREDATVVGKTTGRPVIQLEDLIVALRSTTATRDAAMSVSIDPTPSRSAVIARFMASAARCLPRRDRKSVV